ncbi:MAG: Na(+)/H(+) antiporter subunit C [Ilumatobacteraceae bacterium]
MSLSMLVLVGVLFASGTYLLMERSLTRIALGVGILGNGVNLLIEFAGSEPGEAPIIGRSGELTDPLPQALVLTAIVIGFALMAFLLALAWRTWTMTDDDEVEDDVEDRLIRRREESAGSGGDVRDREDIS